MVPHGLLKPQETNVQSACYESFIPASCVHDFASAAASKLTITVGEELARNFVLPCNWFSHVNAALQHCGEHVKMCVFKTWIGGWTTSHRMHEPVQMSCLFGCRDCEDTIRHYFECSPLWQLAGEALRVTAPLDLRERLCILNPSVEHFHLLALSFQGYHYAKSLCTGEGAARDLFQDARHLQASVQHAMRNFRHSFRS